MREFLCLRVWLRGPGARARADRLVAETWQAGASGHEESLAGGPAKASGAAGVEMVIYAPLDSAEAVWRAARGVLEETDEASPPESVESTDWTQAWTQGLQAIEISPRLVVRPSCVASELRPHQMELVVDPGLAFGTGTHASTRLVLEWLCELESRHCIEPSARVLDVGTGTGLLALAALRLGAGLAVGFDIDPLAPPEALRWARHNALTDRFRSFTGPVEALAGPPFDLVLANLLRSELLPIAAAVAERVAPGGRLILSGLLVSEQARVEAAMAGLGLQVLEHRDRLDGTGDHWLSLLLAWRR